jgi:hypothetical protein
LILSAGIIATQTVRDITRFECAISDTAGARYRALPVHDIAETVTFTMEDEDEDEDSMNSANKDSSNQVMKA